MKWKGAKPLQSPGPGTTGSVFTLLIYVNEGPEKHSFLQDTKAKADMTTENRPCTLTKTLRLFMLLSSTSRNWEVMSPCAPGYEEAFKVMLSHRLLVPRLEGMLHIGCCLSFRALCGVI